MLCISSNKTTEENQSSFDAPNGVTHKKNLIIIKSIYAAQNLKWCIKSKNSVNSKNYFKHYLKFKYN